MSETNGVHANGRGALPATDQAWREEENAALLRKLARLVAEELKVEALRPALRELVLFAELEREAVRRDGVGRSLLFGMRKAGIHVRLDEQGRLMIGPKEALTHQWRRFVNIFRPELVRELTQGW